MSIKLLHSVAHELEQEQIPLGEALAQSLRGALAQATIYKTMKKEGFTLFMPNPEDDEQLGWWDVVGGADLVAVKYHNGAYRVLLIDAKSDRTVHTMSHTAPKGKVYIQSQSFADFQHPSQREAVYTIAADAIELTIQGVQQRHYSTDPQAQRDALYDKLQYARVQRIEMYIPTSQSDLTHMAEFTDSGNSTSMIHQLEIIMSKKVSIPMFSLLPRT